MIPSYGILDLAKFREGGVARVAKEPSAAESVRPESGERRKARKESKRMSLDKKVFEAWTMWLAIKHMTHEQSIMFLLEQHPVSAEELKEAYRFIR